MPNNAFFFWVKFDKDPQPIHVRVTNIQEWFLQLENMMKLHAGFPEWIIRDYR